MKYSSEEQKEVREIVRSLSLKEKADLMSGKDFWHSRAIPSWQLESITFSDGPAGLRYQPHSADHLGIFPSVKAACFPSASTLACSWDPKLLEETGNEIGEEAAFWNVDVLLGPGINLIRNPKGGRNFEYYSEDPYLSGTLAAGMVNGIQKHVSACLKHFVMNSQETFRMSVDEQAELSVLCSLYLPAFEIAIALSDPDWVMTSYNKVNGEYTSQSSFLLRDLLKEKAGFEGCIVTDWGAGSNIVQAIRAGSSIEMPASGKANTNSILRAMENGELKESELDQAVTDLILSMIRYRNKKLAAASADDERDHPDTKRSPVLINMEKQKRIAAKAARDSFVLLKNRDNLLPLSSDKKVLFVGPFQKDFPIQGAGSSKVNPSFQTTLDDCKDQYAKTIHHVQGYRLESSEADDVLESEALVEACKNDVVVFLCAYGSSEQLEGLDRRLSTLPDNQLQLLNKLLTLDKPVIFIDAIAGSVEMPFEEKLDAVVYIGLSGGQGIVALLDLLYGKVSFSGHLAQTFALRWQDHPSSRNYPARGPVSRHEEGMYVGYRYFCAAEKDVLYPFGYGLSYCQFKWSDFAVDQDGVHLCITNQSEMEGSDLVQVYIRRHGMPQLRGYQKVKLEAIESKQITIPWNRWSFCDWNEEKKSWTPMNTPCKVQIARDATQIICSRVLESSFIQKVIEKTCEPDHSGDTKCAEEGSGIFKEQRTMEQVLQQDEASFAGHRENQEEALWNLDMDAPVEALSHCSQPILRMLTNALIHIRETSIEKGKPNPVVISILAMPFKAFPKMYGGKPSEQFMQKFVRFANRKSEESSRKGKEN